MLPDTMSAAGAALLSREKPDRPRPGPFADVFPVSDTFTSSGTDYDPNRPKTTEIPPCWGLALHPEYTTPGLRLAVRPEGGGSAIILRPGDSPIMFRRPVSKLSLWPADFDVHRQLWTGNNGPLFTAAMYLFKQEGAVGQQFAQLSARQFPAVLEHKVLLNGEGRPAAFPVAAANTLVLHTAGLRRLRLLVTPRSGANVVAAPADLAVTLRAYVLNPVLSGAPGTPALLVASIEPDRWTLRDPANPVWHPLASSDFAVTQTKLAQDYQVELGGIVAFRVESLAGTGVDRVAVTAVGS